MIDSPIFISIFMSLLTGLVGLIFGYQRFLHRSIDTLKEDFIQLQVKIASEHLTKTELRGMFKELEERFSQQITLHFNALKRDIRK